MSYGMAKETRNSGSSYRSSRRSSGTSYGMAESSYGANKSVKMMSK